MNDEKVLRNVAGDIEYEIQQLRMLGGAEKEEMVTLGTGGIITMVCCQD